eukprot:136417_1
MTSDYSFVATWTYFALYITMFLIVSIVCAVKVTKEHHKQKNIQESIYQYTKTKLIKQWIKLLWQKKKIYLQLIPHFFDQATDIGVVVEFYHLRNENIGINTMYLFATSIFILILHRIISSFAIYQLTKNKSFILYQLFDVLMIRCIWTNYKLESDEPSNAQRYLQTLEATFESAPQTLISAAFLVKSTTGTLSPIVIVSFITSLWSLSSRISADDKIMVQDEWKKIDFSHKKCPCVNYRYFIRVFVWRFLEISSRITLLCLVWLNMGGMSVFIVLVIEFVYLSVICFGLGTVDIMG